MLITKLIFFGTSPFAVPILEKLVEESGFKVLAVVTNPDESSGRKKILTSPPVKTTTKKHGIKIIQPEKLRSNPELFEVLKKINPDICIVASYGKIIPKEYLEIPKFGFINVHPSLLPKYRGPTPIQTAILNGEKETGVTVILMDEKIDHGPILKSKSLKLKGKNHKELERELSELGAKLLIETIPNLISGKIKPKDQDHDKATFTKKITREDGKINWSDSAEKVLNQIRALNPEPGTWTLWNGRDLKILETKISDKEKEGAPGTIFSDKTNLFIKTGGKWLEILKLQLSGKRITEAKEFLNSYSRINGYVLE